MPLIYRHYYHSDFKNNHKYLADNESAYLNCNNIVLMVDNKLKPINGIVRTEFSISYYESGLKHNLYGPALIRFNSYIDDEYYFYYKGNQTDCKTQEEFNQFIKKMIFQ